MPLSQASAREHAALLHQDDTPLVLEVFWDLFRQGAITLGLTRINRAGLGIGSVDLAAKIAQHTPFRFHDTKAYIELLKTYVPDVSPDAVAYLGVPF